MRSLCCHLLGAFGRGILLCGFLPAEAKESLSRDVSRSSSRTLTGIELIIHTFSVLSYTQQEPPHRLHSPVGVDGGSTCTTNGVYRSWHGSYSYVARFYIVACCTHRQCEFMPSPIHLAISGSLPVTSQDAPR